MGPEPGEERQFLRTTEHVHRVDLDQPDPIDHPASVASVGRPGGAPIGESLGTEGDATGEGRAERWQTLG